MQFWLLAPVLSSFFDSVSPAMIQPSSSAIPGRKGGAFPHGSSLIRMGVGFAGS